MRRRGGEWWRGGGAATVVEVGVGVMCSALPHRRQILEGDVSLRAAVNTVGDWCHGNGVEGGAAGADCAAAKRA